MASTRPTEEPHATSEKIRTLVIDDSALMRQLLTALLSEDDDIEVVGTAPDPYVAREKIKRLDPHVLTLDVDMPGMDGLKFLENLMRLRPMPVIMVSSLTRDGAATTLKALELGAIDIIAKPHGSLRDGIPAIGEELRTKVRAAAHVHLGHARALHAHGKSLPALPMQASRCERGVIVIGASAGGTQAIGEILMRLPARMPPIVIVQHMPPKFTGYFAERLNDHCALDVQEACDGDALRPGLALIAPGGLQTELRATAEGYCVHVHDGPEVNRHKPSVDVLFESAARFAGGNTVGLILTGMGGDGARGLNALRRRGAFTLAQDEHTCLVFGMPERAIREGGVCEVLPLDRMAERLVEWSGVSGS